MNKLLNHTMTAVALLGLTLTSCQKQLGGADLEADQGTESTSLMVMLSTDVSTGGSVRSVTDAQDTEVPGATGSGEEVVKHLSLAMVPGIYLSSNTPPTPVTGETGAYSFLFKDVIIPVQNQFRTSVLLGQLSPTLTMADFNANKAVTYDQLRMLASDENGFVMTSNVETKNITLKPNVTEPSKTNGNFLTYEVERVVSKGWVSYDKDDLNISTFDKKYAPTGKSSLIHPIGWVAVGGAKSAYLFRNHAGRRTLGNNSDADHGFYTDLKTLSAVDKASGSYGLFKLSDFVSMTGAEIDAAKANPILFFHGFSGKFDSGEISKGYNGSGDESNNGVSVKDSSHANAPYFLEHALNETKENRSSYPATITFADIAYAKILTQMKSVRGWMVDASAAGLPFYYKVTSGDPLEGQATTDIDGYTQLELSVPYQSPSSLKLVATDASGADGDQFAMRRYLVEVSEEWYNANKDKRYPSNEGQLNLDDPAQSSLYPSKTGNDLYHFVKLIFTNSDGSKDPRWFFEVRDRQLDYYVGVNDGNVYNSLLAARVARNDKSRKYTLGQAYYLVPFNAQQNEAGKIYNCDTRRNNIYDLRITAIDGMGYNYDPVDPDDPYMPKPKDNPDEPKTAIPPVNKYPQTIRIKAQILKWNYIHYSADLKALNSKMTLE